MKFRLSRPEASAISVSRPLTLLTAWCALLLLLVTASGRAHAQLTGDVPQGGYGILSASIPGDAPANFLRWDIVQPFGPTFASSNNTHGWSVIFDTLRLQFIVSAPQDAQRSDLPPFPFYEVRYQIDAFHYASASFAVVSGDLVIKPNKLILNPNSVVGGDPSTGTVTLSGTAPRGGLYVNLSSSDTTIATVQSKVLVPEGKTSATFWVNTLVVQLSGQVTITASMSDPMNSKTAILSVEPVVALSLNPPLIVGGVSGTGKVTLGKPAPTGGATVQLTNTDTTLASIPTTVVVPVGATSATFSFSTTAVSTAKTAYFTASYSKGRSTAQETVVSPYTLSTLTLNPTSIIGGNTCTGTVTLMNPAPAGGISVNLSSDSFLGRVPVFVLVPAGQTSANFTISTSAISYTAQATITARYGGISKVAKLVITP